MPLTSEVLVPTERDVIVAKESWCQIGSLKFGKQESVAVRIKGKELSVPSAFMRMMIGALAKGKAVAIMPVEKEVSPPEAAEILKASRRQAAELFDEGAIPSLRTASTVGR